MSGNTPGVDASTTLTERLQPLLRYGRYVDLDSSVDAAEDERTAGASAVIVVGGLVTLEVVLSGTHAAELLGPGDIAGLDGDHLPTHYEHVRPLDRARVFVLQERATELVTRYPEVGASLLRSALERHRRQGIHRAILQLSAMEDRILGMAWLLAQRWGRVTPEGVRLDLPLTHATFGRLVGGSRSTVTSAMGVLAAEGHLRRGDGRRLVLDPASRSLARRAVELS